MIFVILLTFYVVIVTLLNAQAYATFYEKNFSRLINEVQYLEYMHIPKCGSVINEKFCKSGIQCVGREEWKSKCNILGQHCDWSPKYECFNKGMGKKKPLLFFTLLRDPVSRVRSYFIYFKERGCGKRGGWTRGMCKSAHNYTSWLLEEDNWVHNHMTRMLYGKGGGSKHCTGSIHHEKLFWKNELKKKLPTLQYSALRIPRIINESKWIFERAKQNLLQHFLVWAPTSQIRSLNCIVNVARGGTNPMFENLTKRRKNRKIDPNIFSEHPDVHAQITLKLNKLDDALYAWGIQYYNTIKQQFPACESL